MKHSKIDRPTNQKTNTEQTFESKLIENEADRMGNTPEEKKMLRQFGKLLIKKYIRVRFGKSE